jgi:hypothetical protein
MEGFFLIYIVEAWKDFVWEGVEVIKKRLGQSHDSSCLFAENSRLTTD